jgi:protein-L-isoaspartate(D-aspartate) O-methyltransferase
MDMSGSDDPAARLRAEMVAHLSGPGGLADSRVAAVFCQVPRHLFVPGAELSEAYANQPIVTHRRDGMPTSSASQPSIVAAMLEQLNPPSGGSILEIGAGTGYNAALLSGLVGPSGRVVTIDIDPEVADEARSHLSTACISNVEVICGDGALGRAEGAPYDGIIVTASASDLAPAWVDQLAPAGRLVLPLSIRGMQQCVAFTPDGGHLRSVAVCDGGFMPLAGVMASTDIRQQVPGHPGVLVQAASRTQVDADLVASALKAPGPAAGLGLTASRREAYGLRRWLAFHEPAFAVVSYSGTPEGAGASGVPAITEFTRHGAVWRSALCLLGPAGFAALDSAGPPATGDGSGTGPGRMLELRVCVYGSAEAEATRLSELVRAWDAEGRPGAERLRIDAYPAGVLPPDVVGIVHAAPHTTFVISSAGALPQSDRKSY